MSMHSAWAVCTHSSAGSYTTAVAVTEARGTTTPHDADMAAAAALNCAMAELAHAECECPCADGM